MRSEDNGSVNGVNRQWSKMQPGTEVPENFQILRAGMPVHLVKALPANEAVICQFDGQLPSKDSQAIYANDKTLILVRKVTVGGAQLRSLTISEALLSLVGYEIEEFAIRTLYDGLPKQFPIQFSIFASEFIELVAKKEKEFLTSAEAQQKGQLAELKIFSQVETRLGTSSNYLAVTYILHLADNQFTTELQVESQQSQLANLTRSVPKQSKEVRALLKKVIGT